MIKILAVLAPVLVLLGYGLWRRIAGRPLSRSSVHMIVSLLLLYYLAVTSGLGLFWVSRMELPGFDLHYLFGYCVLALLVLHLYFVRRRVLSYLGLSARGTVMILIVTGLGFLVAFYLPTSSPPPPVLLPAENNVPVENGEPGGVESRYLHCDDMETDGGSPSFLPTADAEANSPRTIQLRVGSEIMTAAEYILRATSLGAAGSGFRLPLTSPGEFKEWPAQAYVALPPPRVRAGVSLDEALIRQGRRPGLSSGMADRRDRDRDGSHRALTLAQISDVLHHANGITESRRFPGGTIHLRAAPSAGALYPIDLYLAVRNVAGLAPGLYYYHPLRHALARVGGPERLDKIARATATETAIRGAAAVIVATGVWDRTAWKYGHRSFRYVLMDLGHIIGNLTLAVSSNGIPFRLVGRFDDEQLTRALGVNEADEAALLMVTLGATPSINSATIRNFEEVRPSDGWEAMELTRRAHLLTSWRFAPQGGVMRRPAPVFAFRDAAKETIALPSGRRAIGDLFETIRARRSYRRFAATSLPLDDVTGFLRDVWGGRAPSRGFPTVEGALFLQLYLAVERVDGLEPGLYRYDSRGNVLERIASGRFGQTLYRAGLRQELLDRAAMTLIWAIDTETVGAMDKDRDLRYAFIDVGIAGTNAYLSAVARGWGICGVGAFFDEPVRALMPDAMQSTSIRPIYLISVGPRSR